MAQIIQEATYFGHTNEHYINGEVYVLLMNGTEIKKLDGTGTTDYVTAAYMEANWTHGNHRKT